ncbi:MAG: multiheme c-type cytochrome [Acidobacteriota bacterium]
MPKRILRVVAVPFLLTAFLQLPAQHATEKKPAVWFPNQPAPSGSSYVGHKRCAECHASEAANQARGAMAGALAPANASPVLRARPRLAMRRGPYSYQITRSRNQVVYRVSDGTRSLDAPLLWAFGEGKVGQTFVFRHAGDYWESRVSYYHRLGGLDFTVGTARQPETLEEAFGRRLSPADARDCFGCHATGAVVSGRLEAEAATAGVRCEACHGPGSAHIQAVRSGVAESRIFNPAVLNSDDQSQQFCGSCHRSWSTVMEMPDRGGLDNVRFQPYRIFHSPCYSMDDARIRCVTCHDPHAPLGTAAASYDAKCLACHATARNARTALRHAPPCPVGVRECVNCHMPKVELSSAHFKFTDHRIRVVRAGDKYPN